MTARWWAGRAVGFDVESDSRDPQDARIIQWAIAAVDPGRPPVTASWLVKPERDIPEGAAAVHGITTEYARENGEDREEAVRVLRNSLIEWSGTNDAGVSSPVVGHNLFYDLTVLDREMRRLGLGSLGIDDGWELDGQQFGSGLVSVHVDGRTVAAFACLDTLVMDKMVDRYRPGSRRLEDAAKHYRVKMDGAAHDAAVDCLASLRIAWSIATRCAASTAALYELFADRRRPGDVVTAHTSLAHLTLEEMHRAQTTAAAEQADGLRQHFTRNPDKGDPAGVSGAWPFQPYT